MARGTRRMATIWFILCILSIICICGVIYMYSMVINDRIQNMNLKYTTNATNKFIENSSNSIHSCLNDIFDEIFVISIQSRYETLSITLYQLNRENISYTIWNGHSSHNPYSLNLWETFKQNIDNKRTSNQTTLWNNAKRHKRISLYYNKNAFFLRQNQIEILKYAKNKNLSKILIFEDDILLSNPFWIELFCKIEPFIPEWYILNIGENQKNPWQQSRHFRNIRNNQLYSKPMKFYQKTSESYGTFAFAISYPMYSILINTFDINNQRQINVLPLDNYHHLYVNNKHKQWILSKCFAISPTLVLPDMTSSTIHKIKKTKQEIVDHYIKSRTTLRNMSYFSKYWDLRFSNHTPTYMDRIKAITPSFEQLIRNSPSQIFMKDVQMTDIRMYPNDNDAWNNYLNQIDPHYTGERQHVLVASYWFNQTNDIINNRLKYMNKIISNCSISLIPIQYDILIYNVNQSIIAKQFIASYHRNTLAPLLNSSNINIAVIHGYEAGSNEWFKMFDELISNHVYILHYEHVDHDKQHKKQCGFCRLKMYKYSITVPYVSIIHKKYIVTEYENIISVYNEWNLRKHLIYFKGNIHRNPHGLRLNLYKKLNSKYYQNNRSILFENTHLSSYTNSTSYTTELMDSKFCLFIAGDTPSSCRFYDVISVHCIPIIISDRWLEIGAPFTNFIDYSKMVYFIKEKHFKHLTAEQIVNQMDSYNDNKTDIQLKLQYIFEMKKTLLWHVENSQVATTILNDVCMKHHSIKHPKSVLNDKGHSSQMIDTYNNKNTMNKSDEIDGVILFLILWPAKLNQSLHFANIMRVISQVTKTNVIDIGNIFVINVDENYFYMNETNKNWINLNKNAYFTQQVITSLNIYYNKVNGNKNYLYFQLLCDVTFDDDLSIIVRKAIKTFNNYNIVMYQPDIYWNSWKDFYFKQIICPNDLKLKHAIITDFLIIFMRYELINHFLNDFIQCFASNIYGWGIDQTFNLISFYLNRFYIQDYSFLVHHPKSTGYDKISAGNEAEMTFQCIWNKLKEKNWHNLEYKKKWYNYKKKWFNKNPNVFLPKNMKDILNNSQFTQKCYIEKET